MMSVKKIITSYMGEGLREQLLAIPEDFFDGIREIRIRAFKPVIILYKGQEFYISKEKKLVGDIELGYAATQQDILKILELITSYSMYAFEEELKNGYITLSGGHRVGISGKTILESGLVKSIKNINCLNFRISHEIIGCGNAVLNFVTQPSLMHTMVISPPGCGKTTLLRDLVRLISNMGQTVGVVDERSEIAGCYMGVAQNDVGIRTDVLDGCPKAEGMLMLLRSMSPKVIAVDEIGKEKDIFAIEDIINAGVKLICTAHGKSVEDLRLKPNLSSLLNKRIFDRFIILGQGGSVLSVLDKDYKEMMNK